MGYLSTDTTSKRELILMVTPHVVGNHEEADLLTDEYLTTVKDVKKRIDAKLKNTQADLHIHNADDKTGE